VESTNSSGTSLEGNRQWITIPDKRIIHVWKQSADCRRECKEAPDTDEVYPTFYAESRNPVCANCGEEMEYDHTELLLDTKVFGTP